MRAESRARNTSPQGGQAGEKGTVVGPDQGGESADGAAPPPHHPHPG